MKKLLLFTSAKVRKTDLTVAKQVQDIIENPPVDTTVISLCLSLFAWAKCKTKKDGVKRHTLLDWHGYLHTYVNNIDRKTANN